MSPPNCAHTSPLPQSSSERHARHSEGEPPRVDALPCTSASFARLAHPAAQPQANTAPAITTLATNRGARIAMRQWVARAVAISQRANASRRKSVRGIRYLDHTSVTNQNAQVHAGRNANVGRWTNSGVDEIVHWVQRGTSMCG